MSARERRTPPCRRCRTDSTSPTSSTRTRRRSTRSTTTGLRGTLADDIWAQYGNGEAVTSGDALAKWIEEATTSVIWQHHLLSLYHVTVDGDSAKALSYLTSYQVFKENPDQAVILVARYHDELRRTRRRLEALAAGDGGPLGRDRAEGRLPRSDRRARPEGLGPRLTDRARLALRPTVAPRSPRRQGDR